MHRKVENIWKRSLSSWILLMSKKKPIHEI